MFDILAKYLLEFKHLKLPKIGVFDVSAREANADQAAGTIAPPSWVLEFISNREEAGGSENELLYNWLATSQSISKDEAIAAFKNFSADIEARLAKGEKVEWPGLGVLEQIDDQNIFVPTTENLSPFTNVSAKKL
ncbi:HU family DNA-binding protein [Niabella ginsengisoli]|uniref:Uncharacterized protein n=1 Tax=Niabella ginsengisoli TaxID=522298 RepID=A0ABS9SQV1_9BACT|nr:HU family DNA-binding protein [Niabella ginsengisoli]MCH5600760.1 hypothetical protein [Niabella ginsengisoli]